MKTKVAECLSLRSARAHFITSAIESNMFMYTAAARVAKWPNIGHCGYLYFYNLFSVNLSRTNDTESTADTTSGRSQIGSASTVYVSSGLYHRRCIECDLFGIR